MPPWLTMTLSAFLAWLIGSIPFSLLVARWGGGIDLRQHGSGNVGATNVARTLGAKWGAVALTLDVLKGVIPVLLLPMLFVTPEYLQTHQAVLCGTLAIVGHMFPPWLGFRGGKGVATGLGVAATLAPWPTLIAFGGFAFTFAVVRIVSMSSMVGAIVFAISEVILSGPELWSQKRYTLGIFSIAVPLLIILRHRANLVRIAKGTEPRLTLKRKKDKEKAP